MNQLDLYYSIDTKLSVITITKNLIAQTLMAVSINKAIWHIVLTLIQTFRLRIVSISAYFASLYYLEIILVMFNLVLLWGKAVSVVSGFVLAGLLTKLIISLYSASNISRIILLFIIDIHVAVTISFIPSLWVFDIDLNYITIPTIVLRLVMIFLEIPLIYLLTDPSVIIHYQSKQENLIREL